MPDNLIILFQSFTIRMNYYQITIPIPEHQESIDVLIALLSIIGYDSFEETDKELIAYIPESEFFKKDILENQYVMDCDELGKLKIELMPDKNWNEVWESNYPSVTIANRCYVRAPFHNADPDIEHEIIIKPKMAFGTAHHETTALMLELILGIDMKSYSVLDMGCGSGVLAILASMHGADFVTAIDIDRWSYENTMENAAVNNISNIKVLKGDAELLKDLIAFDVIFANINKNILLRDIKYYAKTLLEGGFIYFSGFYSSDLSDIIEEAKKHGLEFVRNLEKNNWIAAEFKKDV